MKRWCTQLVSLLASLALFTSSAVSAQLLSSAQQLGGTGVAGRLGTLGWSVEVVQSLQPTVNLRLGLNRYHGDYTGTEDQVDYTIDVNLHSVSLLADWHPYDGIFRVTGGVLYNRNKIDVIGKPNDSLRIGDSSYSPAAIGTLVYNVSFRKIAPYLGFGFGNALRQARTFSFVIDFGLVFHGFPNVDISASGLSALLPGFQADLAQEERELEEDLQPFRYYPVIAFGFTYRFL